MNASQPISQPGRRLFHIVAVIMLLPLTACLQFVTQQGNVLKPEKLAGISLEDSRFHVESLIGTPVLKDDLHPNRAIYLEDYNDPDTDKKYQRRVEIIYSEAGRVKSIKHFGFNGSTNEGETDNK